VAVGLNLPEGRASRPPFRQSGSEAIVAQRMRKVWDVEPRDDGSWAVQREAVEARRQHPRD
jgi:hypothetical protein